MTYPDGLVYHCINLIELRDGLAGRETQSGRRPPRPPTGVF